MNQTTFLTTLAWYLAKYSPEQLNMNLKPADSAGCIPCRDIKYDFIIVGAGSAGCALANRLTENTNWNVLLIEAGGDDDYLTDTPVYAGNFHNNNKFDWNYTTVPQRYGCQGTKGVCNYLRGHVMGGCGSINFMFYVRGNPNDYDEWARLGNKGWSYKDVLPYFLKLENMTIPELMTSKYHSTSGPIGVTYSSRRDGIAQDVLNAAIDSGLSFNPDYNGAKQYGVSYMQSNIKESVRSSPLKAYLDPIRARKNLYIFKNTLAIRILFDRSGKKAIGVRCVTNGEKYDVYSSKEVILSAGAINTPQLLMLSGIGPREHLKELGIALVSNLPVGQTLVDHSAVFFPMVLVNDSSMIYSESEAKNAIKNYAVRGQGALTDPQFPITGFMNLTSEIIDTQIVIALLVNGLGQETPPVILVYFSNLKPKSMGTVKLKSANYLDAPLIDPNYFGEESDKLQLKRAIKMGIQIIESRRLAKYSPSVMTNQSSVCTYRNPVNEDDFDCMMKNSFPMLHASGTAKMGPATDKTAVVDPMLRVHGMKSLRVVDASVMPVIPTGNTNIPTIMVAERAADLIKRSY